MQFIQIQPLNRNNIKIPIIGELNCFIDTEDWKIKAKTPTGDVVLLYEGGSGGGSYTLPIASSTVLGGIKIGSGLSIDGSGILSTTPYQIGNGLKLLNGVVTAGDSTVTELIKWQWGLSSLTIDPTINKADLFVSANNNTVGFSTGVYDNAVYSTAYDSNGSYSSHSLDFDESGNAVVYQTAYQENDSFSEFYLGAPLTDVILGSMGSWFMGGSKGPSTFAYIAADDTETKVSLKAYNGTEFYSKTGNNLLLRLGINRIPQISNETYQVLVRDSTTLEMKYVTTSSLSSVIESDPFSWKLLGNSGTTPTTNFIGTIDNVDFNIRTNNVNRINILNDGKIGINGTPTSQFHVFANNNTAGYSMGEFVNSNVGGLAYLSAKNNDGSSIGISATGTSYVTAYDAQNNGNIAANGNFRNFRIISNGDLENGGTMPIVIQPGGFNQAPVGYFYKDYVRLGYVNDSTLSTTFSTNGRVGIGLNVPTSLLDIKASSINQASLRLRVGVAPTTPNDGDIWVESNNQAGAKMRLGGITYDLLTDAGTISNTLVTVTKAQADTLVSTNALVPGQLYMISDADKDLYDDGTNSGTKILLKAATVNKFELQGHGIFYVPKYNQVVNGYDIWDSTATYSVGNKVIWGGYSWTNVNGSVGTSTNIFTLSNSWTKNVFNTTNYNIQVDIIHYDFLNDLIIYREDKAGNVVSSDIDNNFYWNANMAFLGSPINVFQWGNDYNTSSGVGCSENKVIESYFECINSKSANILYNNLKSNSHIRNNTIIGNGYISYNTLCDESYITSNTIGDNFYISYNTICNNSYITQNIINDGAIYKNSLSFSSNITNNTLNDNSSIDNNILQFNSMIISNILNNSYVFNNILNNQSRITSNTMIDSSIESNTFNFAEILSNELTEGYLYYNAFEYYGIISNNIFSAGDFANILLSNSTITNQNLSNKTLQKIKINDSVINTNLSAATTIFGNFSKTVFSREDGTPRLTYYNNSDVLVIVPVTN